MKYKQLHDELYLIEEALSYKDFVAIEDEFYYEKWNFDKRGNGEENCEEYPVRGELQKPYSQSNLSTLGDNLQFIKIGTESKYKCERILRTRLTFLRIHTNIQFFGQESSFHRDIDNPPNNLKFWGLLYFVQSKWNSEWGGDFVCNVGKEYINVPYIPGNAVLFNTQNQHKGMAPNVLCRDARLSLQYLFMQNL